MSYMRFTIDGSIRMDVYDTIPQVKKDAFKNSVNAIKAYCQKINAGQPNEENTISVDMTKGNLATPNRRYR